jgi:Zn-dependent membrane protease YugP
MSFLMFILPALLLSLYAQWKVKTTFSRYAKVSSRQGYSGAEAAGIILRHNGMGSTVNIEPVAGSLSDHYDPSSHTVRLSEDVYGNRSLAAIGVAAHEVGHAMQHQQEYGPLALRHGLVPITNLASTASFPIIIAGYFLNSLNLVMLGVMLFSMVVLFHLVTLPVELNASRRAVTQLSETGLIDADEVDGVKRVLGAAAFTYVAATLSAVSTLLYYLMIFMGRDD